MRIDYPRANRRGVLRLLPSWRQLLSLALLAVVAVVAAFAVAYALIPVPEPKNQALEQVSIAYYRDGTTELGRFGDVNRTIVRLDQIPKPTQQAVLAAEDRSFYSNAGVSPRGIARAFVSNLRNSSTQGGSTITQQYVKNVYLTQERTLSRKLKEFVLSVKINNQNSKEKILEDYLNTIYWGRGAYGIQAASQAYFGKSVGKLSTSESAFLAGIIQSPERYDPTKNRQGAERRWNYVLDGMVAMGNADPQARAALTFPEVQERPTSNRLGGPKGYLLAVVKDELAQLGYDEEQVDTGGLRITSTFSKKAQDAAIAAVKDNFPTQNAKGVHVGLTSVVPGSGQIVAMYGGPDYVAAPGQNAALAQIQGGSTFKPFTLAAALKAGIGLRSRFSGNSPLQLPNGGRVRNEFNTDYGYRVDLRYATAQSINTAFVDLTLQLGASKVRDAIVNAGLPADTPGLESNALITLGTASVNSLEMANAYATFAANGLRANHPYTVLSIRGDNGGVIYRAPDDTTQAVDPEIAASVTDALVGVVQNGTGTAAQGVGRPVAGKTGTAQDLTAWFVGYTPQLSTAVEFYNGDGTKSLDQVGGLSTFFGGGYPTDIWTQYMTGALDGADVRQFPDPPRHGTTLDPRPTFTLRPSGTPTPTPTPGASDGTTPDSGTPAPPGPSGPPGAPSTPPAAGAGAGAAAAPAPAGATP